MAALAQGALLGARGNSGMILSQILRGLAEILGAGMRGRRALWPAPPGWPVAAVADPGEGTMLTRRRGGGGRRPRPTGTVGRRLGWRVAEHARRAGRHARAAGGAGQHGVVDAGAAGLCVLLDVLAAVTTESSRTATRSAGLVRRSAGAAAANRPSRGSATR